MKKKLRAKLRFFALIIIAALMLACASIIMFKPQTANAMDTSSGTVSVYNGEDIYNDISNRFNKKGLQDLFTKLGKGAGVSNVTTYTALNNAYTAPVTSATLSSANGGDLIVKFGGYDWTITYLSKDKSGNLIATLYYSDEEVNSAFSNGWYSATTSGGYSGYKYSSHYGGSYLRAVALGIGGRYYTSTVNGAVDNDVSIATATNEQVQESKFYQFAQGTFATYLVAPSDVAWQTEQFDSTYSTTRAQNCNLVEVTDHWYPNIYNSTLNDDLYYLWGNDKIWLPSLAETGWSAGNRGIWETSINQCKSNSESGYSWTRSGSTVYSHYADPINADGLSPKLALHTANVFGVRPCVHLNLSKAFGNGVFADIAAPVAITGTKTYNASAINAIQKIEGSKVDLTVTKDGVSTTDYTLNTSTGVLSATLSGTYAVTFTIKDKYAYSDVTYSTDDGAWVHKTLKGTDGYPLPVPVWNSSEVSLGGNAVTSQAGYEILTAPITINFTIEKKTITINWLGEGSSTTDFSWGYDGTAHAPTYTVSGQAGSEKVLLTADYQDSTGGYASSPNKNAGDYVMRLRFTSDSVNANYQFSGGATSVTQKYTITKAPLTVKWYGEDDSATDFSWVFNDTAYTPTAKLYLSGGSEASEPTLQYAYAVQSGAAGSLESGGAPRHAGKYTVTVSLTTDSVNSNYSFTSASKEFEISKRTADGFAWTTGTYTYNNRAQTPTAVAYDKNGAALTLTYIYQTYTGASLGATTAATAPVNAGNYRVTAQLTNDDYALPADPYANFTIEQCEVTVVWSWTGFTEVSGQYRTTYNAAAQSPAASAVASGIYANDGAPMPSTQTLNLTKSILHGGSAITGAIAASDTAYTASVTLSGDDMTNYKLAESSVSFYIDKYKISATEIQWYNGSTLLNTAEQVTFSYGTEPDVSGQAVLTLNGTQITITFEPSGNGYDPYYENMTWPKRDYTYTAKLSTADAVNFDVESGDLVLSFTIVDAQVQAEKISVVWVIELDGKYERITSGYKFTYNGKVQAPIALGYPSGSAIDITNSGTYRVLSVLGADNADVGVYTAFASSNLSASVPYFIVDGTDVFKYEITPYTVNISWQVAADGYVYTGSAQRPEPKYDGNALGTLLAEFEGLFDIGSAVDAGTYTIYATAGRNYALSVEGAAAEERISITFTINKFLVEKIDWDATTFDYDGTEKSPKPTLDGEYSFLKISVEGSATDAGTYVAFATLTDDDVNKNYRLSATAARVIYTITAKTIDVVWTDGGSDTFEWEYDGETHVPVATVDGTQITVTGGGVNAGRYTAVATINNRNYVLSNATQAFVITKKTLTVTACDVENLEYGSNLTSRFAVTYSGFADGEDEDSAGVWLDGKGTVMYSCPYVAGSAVNTYPITPYGLEALNYNIQYVAGTLTVVKRNITVTIDDATSVYGAPLANLTYRLTDSDELYNNDNLGITLVKDGGLDAGTYDITGTASNINYNVTFQNTGVYEITRAQLTVKANDNTIVYGDDGEWADGYTISGFMYGDGENADSIISGEVTYTYSYALYGNVGKYAITPEVSGLSADNYTFTTASGVLFVTPKAITVTIADKESVYGQTEVELTSNAAEVVLNGDDLHLSLVRGRSDRDDAGAYAITCTSYSNTNYIVTFVNGTYTIKPYEINVRWSAGNDGYEEDGIYYFKYNGQMQYPLATFTDWGGSERTLTVSGGRTRAGVKFTAEAVLPKNSTNYVFAADTNNTCLFTVKPKVITITWYQSYNPTTGKYSTPIAQGGTAEYTFSSGIYWHPYAVASGIVGNDEITIIVVGAAMQVGGNYTAEAVISDTVGNGNYLISGASKTCKFTINAITGDGFSWYLTDGSNEVITDGYKYTYDGFAHQPWIKSGLSDKYLYVVTYADGTTCGGAAVNVGSYKVVATPLDQNLIIPAGQDTFTFEIAPMTVTVVWSPNDGNGKIAFEYNGAEQLPGAYFIDAFGNCVNLDVTGDRQSIDADTYAASVSLPEGGNYKFAAGYEDTVSFTITEKIITVVWTSAIDGGEWKMEYGGAAVTADEIYAMATMSNAVAGDSVSLVHTILLNGKPVTEIRNAGIYTLKVELAGRNTNYKVVDAEHEFEITKPALEITVDPNICVNYGDPTPVFDESNVEICGFAGGESAESLGLVENGTYYWVYTEYNENSSPRSEGYDAELVTWLIDPVAYTKFADALKNYEVTFNKGHITVIAVVGDVILFGTFNTGSDMYYNGSAQLPTAYYKGRNDKLISLAVTLMTDDSYTAVSDAAAVDVGIYFIKVSKLAEDTDETVLKQDEWTFEIKKIDVQVDIADVKFTYGEVTDENYAAGLKYSYNTLLSIDAIFNYDAAKAAEFRSRFENNMLGIELNVDLTCDGEGYVNAGEYLIYGSWSLDESLRNNFSVKFVGTQEGVDGSNSAGLYIVEKAQITVITPDGEVNQISYLKGDPIYVELGIVNTDPATAELYKYAYIRLAGAYDAEVAISYVRYNLETYKLEDINTPERDEEHNNFSVGNPAFEQKEGRWLINYKIEAANHETYFGQWLVEILPDTNRINITFVKPYEVVYGEEMLTGKELTKALLDGGYIRIDNVLSSTEFAQYATAYVSYGRAQGSVSAGDYTITFVIDKIPGSTVEYIANYSNFSNVNAYTVTPRLLEIEWGTTSFVYDGTVKLDFVAATVTGFINGGELEIGGLEAESVKNFTFNDGNCDVTLSVTAESGYDFIACGGHQLTVKVDNSNYTIRLDNAAKAVSISYVAAPEAPVPETPVATGIEPWLLYTLIGVAAALAVIMLILIIVAAKRKSASDDDGFYEKLEAEQQDASKEL